jgi:nitrite reductase (NADH) small subunit
MEHHLVCYAAELPPGKRKIVQIGGRSIGVFNIKGSYFALRNSCPHQGAPLCLGRVSGTTLPSKAGTYIYGRENEILTCPWHGWEFDILTGKSLYDPHKCLVKTYEVTLEPSEQQSENVQLETYAVTLENDVVILHV